jgi:N-acylneuraminate cytidylyltransferase
MIEGKRVLAVIPARGGSKGVARKNVRLVAGKPLIAYSIETAQRSQYIDRIVVSSEDDEILATAARFGAEPLHRPKQLAADETPGVAPALHAIEALPGFDLVVLLQPTSPLRVSRDIEACIERCVASGMTACVSLVEAEQSPYWMFSLTPGQTLQPIVEVDGALIARRQDLPPAYLLNGAVYAAGCAWLASHGTFVRPGIAGWVMPAERSLDIDTESDLACFSQFVLRSKS